MFVPTETVPIKDMSTTILTFTQTIAQNTFNLISYKLTSLINPTIMPTAHSTGIVLGLG